MFPAFNGLYNELINQTWIVILKSFQATEKSDEIKCHTKKANTNKTNQALQNIRKHAITFIKAPCQ